MSEHDEQCALFEWADIAKQKYPELSLLFAIPNGGKRDIQVARKLKAEGVRAGVPDIFLPVPRKNYHGLFIELKYQRGRATQNQLRWLHVLMNYGYNCKICYGWEHAKHTITQYLTHERDRSQSDRESCGRC